MSEHRRWVNYFKNKIDGIEISDLSTKRFYIENDKLIEERLIGDKPWAKGRVWPLKDVEILIEGEIEPQHR